MTASRRRAETPEQRFQREYHTTVNKAARRTGGTGQTAMRLQETPLARLRRRGAFSVAESEAAEAIMHAYRVSVGATSPRTGSGDGLPSQRDPHAAEGAAARRVDALARWRGWRLTCPVPALIAAMAILVEETSLRVLERRERWKSGRASELLIDALRHWNGLRC